MDNVIEALKIMEIEPDHLLTHDELKKKYLSLAKKYHPDSNSIYSNSDMFSKMKSAYDYLNDNIEYVNETIKMMNNKEYQYDNIYNDTIEISEEDFRKYDKISLITLIISFILPLYGILIYLVRRILFPSSSKLYLIASVLGIIVFIFLFI